MYEQRLSNRENHRQLEGVSAPPAINIRVHRNKGNMPYAYYGIGGNIRALLKVYRAVERYWHRMLCSRSWAGAHLTWDAFH